MNGFFVPPCVPIRITITKLYLIAKRGGGGVFGVAGMLSKTGGLSTGEPDVSVVLDSVFMIGLPVSPMQT